MCKAATQASPDLVRSAHGPCRPLCGTKPSVKHEPPSIGSNKETNKPTAPHAGCRRTNTLVTETQALGSKFLVGITPKEHTPKQREAGPTPDAGPDISALVAGLVSSLRGTACVSGEEEKGCLCLCRWKWNSSLRRGGTDAGRRLTRVLPGGSPCTYQPTEKPAVTPFLAVPRERPGRHGWSAARRERTDPAGRRAPASQETGLRPWQSAPTPAPGAPSPIGPQGLATDLRRRRREEHVGRW